MGKIKPRVSTEAQIDVVVARCAQLWRGDSRKEFSAYCEEQLRRRGYPVTMLALAAIRTARAELFADPGRRGAVDADAGGRSGGVCQGIVNPLRRSGPRMTRGAAVSMQLRRLERAARR